MTNPAGQLRAACLTPPAVGGIAVIQVIGRGAAEVVNPLLKSAKAVDLHGMAPDELRLCRILENDAVLDDALVAIRRNRRGEDVVDLSVHGGMRIVQRVLLLLKRSGVRICESPETRDEAWPACSTIEREAIAALWRAKTRRIALWLARMQHVLPAEIEQIVGMLRGGRRDAAVSRLARLCATGRSAACLLDGIRIVLVGEPNTGKSTLANALAEREHAVVSDVPGTTRDWVEHPAAIEGIPVTLVDTAGLRDTDDPVEREAVRRTREQIASADLLVHVIDASLAPRPADLAAVSRPGTACVFVWNKSDQPPHPGHAPAQRQAGDRGATVSALTGAGLSELREGLISAARLRDWSETAPGLFTRRQTDTARQAVEGLRSGRISDEAAARMLLALVGPDAAPEDGRCQGYN